MPEAAGDPATPKVAVVLASGLAPGEAANVAACLAAGLAASDPTWAGRPLVDAAGLASVASSHVPIAVLRAEPDALQALVRRLVAEPPPPDAGVSVFPVYARSMHDGGSYWARHADTRHLDEPLLGLAVRGPRRWVTRLTGSLGLWR